MRGVGAALAEKLRGSVSRRCRTCCSCCRCATRTARACATIGALLPGVRAAVEGEVQLTEVAYRRRRQLLCRISDGSGFLTLRFFYFSAPSRTGSPAARASAASVRSVAGRSGWRSFIRSTAACGRRHGVRCARGNADTRLSADRRRAAGRLRALINEALRELETSAVRDWIPPQLIIAQLGLPSLQGRAHLRAPSAARGAVATSSRPAGIPAQRRLAFEELLAHHLSLKLLKRAAKTDPGLATAGPRGARGAVHRVAAVRADRRTARALHDDRRRSGAATADGAAACRAMSVAARPSSRGRGGAAAVGSGLQAALMAPTELLAEQHWRNFRDWFEPLGLTVGVALRLAAGPDAAQRASRRSPRARSGSSSARTRCFRTGSISPISPSSSSTSSIASACSSGCGCRRRGGEHGRYPASADHDGDADSAHARDDRLRGPRHLRHRRAAAGPHAREDGGRAGAAARRSRRAHRAELPSRPAGVLGVPADRGVRGAALAGRGGDRRGAGRGAARKCASGSSTGGCRRRRKTRRCSPSRRARSSCWSPRR